MFLTAAPNKSVEYLQVQNEQDLPALKGAASSVPLDTLSSESWVFGGKERRAIFQKINGCAKPLLDLGVAISRGTSSGADEVFVVTKTNQTGVYLTRDGEKVRLESGVLRTPLYATDFRRYFFAPVAEERIVFPYEVGPQSSSLISEKEFKSRFPRAYDYLRSRRKALEGRQQFTYWYGFSAPRNLPLHDAANLLVPLLADRGSFSEFPPGQDSYCLMASGGFSITIPNDGPTSHRYVLGLLNSKLLFCYLHSISNVFRGGWITCTKQYVGRIPIRLVDFSDPADKARHDKMVKLVDRMLELNKQKHSGKLAPSQVERVDREIAATDAEIDGLVYDLYGITDAEREIIKGS
jgi:hypothetical protein